MTTEEQQHARGGWWQERKNAQRVSWPQESAMIEEQKCSKDTMAIGVEHRMTIEGIGGNPWLENTCQNVSSGG